MIITDKISITYIQTSFWKILGGVVILTIASFYINEYFLKEYFNLPALIPTILGTALAFFIGFNNNQAYDRWWEARKIWGKLVNDSRTWVRHVLYYTNISDQMSKTELDETRKRMINRHIAFLYALKENLRKSELKEYKKYLSEGEFNQVETFSNVHNALLNNQSAELENLHSKGAVDGFRFIELNRSLVGFCDEMGKSERIKNTVFPTTYQRYTQIFIWLFIICATLVMADLVGYWSILFATLIGDVFKTTHSIGLALLNPFDEIITGIPLNQITRTIEINLLETLGEKDIPKPIESVGGKYVM